MAGPVRLGTTEARIVDAPLVDGPVVEGPFSVGVMFARDAGGRLACVVAAKLTARLLPDECPVEPQPEPVLRVEQLRAPTASPLARVVSRPRDLVPVRFAPEVVVVGSAFAIGGPTDHVLARVAVADVDASVEAWAPRLWLPDGSLEVQRASLFPLDLSRSAGGPGTDNPVGVDPSGLAARGRLAVPSVVPPLFVPSAPGGFVPFASLGPLAPDAPLRASRLREEDRRWLRAPHASPEPAGFDPRFFQAAPPTSWAGRPFEADEWLVLEGLHPRVARLGTRLPGLAPRLAVDGAPVPMAAELLVVDSDAGVVTLTWRGGFLVDGRRTVRIAVTGQEDGEVTRDHEPTRDISGEELEVVLAAPPPRAAPAPRPSSGGLPFAENPPAPRPSRPSAGDGALPFRADGPAPPALVGAPSASLVAPPSLAAASDLALLAPRQAGDGDPPTGPLPALSVEAPPPLPPAQKVGGQTIGAQTMGVPTITAVAPAATPVEPPGKARFDGAFGRGAPRATTAGPSVRGASDAAAGPRDPGPGRGRPSALPAEAERLRAVDLWGFEPSLAARLRRPPWAPLLKAVQRATPRHVDEPVAEPTGDELARRDVLRVLSFGEARDLAEARRAADAALDDAQELEPPLALLVGEARAVFDEVEQLRATVAAAQPLAGRDKKLAQAVAVAQEALAAQAPPSAELASALARSIEQAAAPLGLPARHLERQAERALLEERRLRRRPVFGGPRVRVELSVGGEALPCYLDEPWAPRWPLLASVPVVVLAELRPREDAGEAAPEALLARAAGRVLRARG